MKSYLSLIPIAEKKNNKQSKMTRLCIVLAVFLVTAIFSMADMEMRSQLRQAIRDNGYWHVNLDHLSEDEVKLLRAMSGIEAMSGYGTVNFHLEQDYQMEGKKVVICGCEPDFSKIYTSAKLKGKIPTNENEVMISSQMAEKHHKAIGDKVILSLPDGSTQTFTITGTTADTESIQKNDCYGLIVSLETAKKLANIGQEKLIYFIRLKESVDTRKTIDALKERFNDPQRKISENVKLLGITGKSRNSYMMNLYLSAGVLAVLVITAGVLMITSNINSNLAKRVEFFGMLRCIGASTQQIKRFVVLEALNWCKEAIPLGVLSGTVVSWVLCAVLKFLSPAYFAGMPVLAVSIVGILMGACIGILTVLLAAFMPACKAAQVSPLTAVSGNAYSSEKHYRKMHIGLLPIELKLGIHHSYESKKNFILMVSAFALSIILFLGFSIGIDFLHHALKPLQVYTPDLSIYAKDKSCSIGRTSLETIGDYEGIKNIYGRSFSYSMPAQRNHKEDLKIDLISYDDIQFNWARKKIAEGSIENVIDGEEVLTVYDKSNPLQVGDELVIETTEGSYFTKVGAILTDSPFSSDEGKQIVICSEETFKKITGKSEYTIIDIQLTSKVSDETVERIRELFSDEYTFSDQRESNKSVRGAYLSMAVFMYGFIGIIALISIFQVINSIAMSVNARVRQYGAMRAIGISNRQLARMIIAEAITYSLFGSILGTTFGLLVNKFLFNVMITSHWKEVWKIPIGELATILVVMAGACLLAVYRPVKEINKQSIVETLSTY